MTSRIHPPLCPRKAGSSTVRRQLSTVHRQLSIVHRPPSILLLILLLCNSLTAQLSYTTVQIPTRDSKFLAADIYLPDTVNTFSTILIQTPYDKDDFHTTGLPLGIGMNQAGSNFAFVILDWRCFYGSASACIAQPNRGEDGYDAVEWIAAQPWSNGRVGTWGPSALGNIQFMTAAQQPPHLICAAPEVASPQTQYQAYLPGGAARTEYLQTLGVLFGGGIASVVAANPHYNLLWQVSESTTDYTPTVGVPMFLVAGWFDHNTDIDIDLLEKLQTSSLPAVRSSHKLLVGPWVHGGTGIAHVGSTIQGDLSFPGAANWNDSLELEFFEYYLNNALNGWPSQPTVRYFQMGDDVWQSSTDWPPAGTVNQRLYLHDDGGLRSNTPAAAVSSLGYDYDPLDPSPTVGGKTLSLSLVQGPLNQIPAVESRNDVLIFTSDSLTQDVKVQGKISLHLQVSSDRKDTDMMARITDVYPDGRSILMGETVLRMRFRDGFAVADTAFMTGGTVYPIDLDFEHLAQTFKAGHRIRIIVSSSNYPRFNRNMNTGGDLYPGGNLDTLVGPLIAHNTLHLGSSTLSWVDLPVQMGASGVEVDRELLEWDVFPNPISGGICHVRASEPGMCILYDLQGRRVGEFTVQAGEQEVQLPEGLPAGTYGCVLMTSGSAAGMKKLVVLR
jgi:predicted acyl esterase